MEPIKHTAIVEIGIQIHTGNTVEAWGSQEITCLQKEATP
jgi:hypothetical protein